MRAYDAGGNAGPIHPYRFYVTSPEVADKPGDLNGDGLPDMLAIDETSNLLIYGGTGDGAVATKVPLSEEGEWDAALLAHQW